MTKPSLENLIGQINEKIGEQREASTVQQEVLRQLDLLSHDNDEEPPHIPDLVESCELLLEDWQQSHPHLSQTLQELIDHLSALGI